MGDLIEVCASLKNVLLEVALFYLGNQSQMAKTACSHPDRMQERGCPGLFSRATEFSLYT